MLNTISWSEFLIASAIALLAYYTVTTVILFRHEIRNWIKGFSFSSSSSSSSNQQRQDSLGRDALMGEARHRATPVEDSGQEATTQFSPNQLDEVEEAESFYTLDEAAYQASVSNLLTELNSLLSELPSDKGQALDQLQIVFQRYAHLHPADRTQITDYSASALLHHTQLQVTTEELNACWPKVEP